MKVVVRLPRGLTVAEYERLIRESMREAHRIDRRPTWPDPYPWACNICEARYEHQDGVVHHLREVHGVVITEGNRVSA